MGSRFQLACMFVKSSAKVHHGSFALAFILFGQAPCEGLKLTVHP